MDAWRTVFRKGVEPLLSTPGLEALRLALVNDDPRLIQGLTTTPPAIRPVMDWPVDGACAVSLCGWLGDGLETVGEVDLDFAEKCYKIDAAMGEPAACRFFLNWFDETPRNDMRQQLLPEVERALEARRQAGNGSDQ